MLEVLVMPNNEILCGGKTIGYTKELGKYLNKPQAIEIPFTDSDIEELASGHEFDWTYPTKCGQDIKVKLVLDNDSNE